MIGVQYTLFNGSNIFFDRKELRFKMFDMVIDAEKLKRLSVEKDHIRIPILLQDLPFDVPFHQGFRYGIPVIRFFLKDGYMNFIFPVPNDSEEDYMKHLFPTIPIYDRNFVYFDKQCKSYISLTQLKRLSYLKMFYKRNTVKIIETHTN